MLSFLLAIAAVGLVLTALTHAELRRRVSIEPKWSASVPTGVRLVIFLLVTSIVVLTLAVVGWIADVTTA
jgi:hypothetical protein